jgi:hypothetical protein
MIFSKFFKAKWQHKDSNIRLIAINDELSATKADDINVLQQLLANDDNELVRRAVLLKINTFEQWLLSSSDNSNSKIKEYAYQQLVKMIHGKHVIVLTDQQKKVFLTDDKYNKLLEPWLQSESDTGTIILLFEKINKPHLSNTLFIQKQNEQFQQYLINRTDDLALLAKFSKKAVNTHITDLIASKQSALKSITEKPIKLTKDIQLILAKLLALKDVIEYSKYLEKKAGLQQEWLSAQSNITCLDSLQASQFSKRFNEISEQLDKIFVVKKETYQQQLIEEQLFNEKKATKAEFDSTLTELGHALTNSIFENTLLDEGLFTSQLARLTTQVNASVLIEKEKSRYTLLIQQHALKLTHLPDIAISVSEATSLISKISQLSIPSSLSQYRERQPIYNDWLNSWQEIEKKTSGIIPDSIRSAYREIRNEWQKGLAPFSQQQKQLFSQTQKKLSDLKRLLARGKYNAAFGLFKAIERNQINLSFSQQQKIERDFDTVSKQISELSDWEHYIATPRKQQMLDEINVIIACPLDNPNEQANKVKEFRKAWNLLGHADDELDKPLNDAFNLACEQAFAPCRLFFGEQEKLREQHLANRLSLIEQGKELSKSISNLDISQLDFKVIDGQLNKLSQAWSDAGEVDRQKYNALQFEFTHNLAPIKVIIKAFHEQNISLKNALIDKVKLEFENEDVYHAIENTKKFQNQWREIGYAGPRQDNKLWQNFRKTNDQLFQKRDRLKLGEKELQSSHKLILEQKIEEIKKQLSLTLDKNELTVIRQQALDLHQDVINTKPLVKSFILAIDSFISDIKDQIKALDLAQEKAIWFDIFTVMQSVANNDISKVTINESAEYLRLSPAWRKKLVDGMFTPAINDDVEHHRQVKTLELEILSGLSSPKEYAKQRMQIQVQLMQDKMTSGGDVNLEQSFNKWLIQGALSKNDLPLILRVKPIFCQ